MSATEGGGGVSRFMIFSDKGGGAVCQFLIFYDKGLGFYFFLISEFFSDKGGLNLNKHVE